MQLIWKGVRGAVVAGFAAATWACAGDPAAPGTSAITSLRINPTSRALLVPAGGARTVLIGADQPVGAPPATFRYQTSDPGIATVSGSGGTVTVNGLAEGTTTITLTAEAAGAEGFSSALRSGQVTVTVARVTGDTGLGLGFGPEQFAEVPAGTFAMGSTNGFDDERPVRTVSISRPFLMQKTEVTQAQWQQVMLGTDLENPSLWAACGPRCPVELISHNDILAFLERLNAQDPGRNYRLPTEAEWEYAARDTTKGDFGGNGVLDDMGWWSGNSSARTQPVARKRPNAWGLHDMHGNVWESVSDWYQADYYAVGPAVDPQGPAAGDFRVRRGGSWVDGAENVRSARRAAGLPPALRCGNCGFRVVRSR